jgi:hypothetical protein
MRKLATIAVAVALTATACKTNGTYVMVTFDKAATTPSGIAELDLQMMLGGRSATATVDPGHEITFPATAVVAIGNGSGALSIDVVARDASGAMLDHGHGDGMVVHGQTTSLTVQLGGGGGGGALTVDKTTVDFGSVVVNQSSANAVVTVTNGGTVASGALAVALADTTNFAIVADGCSGMALAANTTCPITVKMTPASAGAKSTMLTVSGMPGGSAVSTLSGNAVMPGPLTLMPMMHDFVAVTQGMTSPEFTFTATNGGNSMTGALQVALGGSDAAAFTVSNDGCTGRTLGPNGQCAIGVTVNGTGAAGAKMATLTVMGSPGGVAVANVTGTLRTPAHLSMSYPNNAFGSVTVMTSGPRVDVTVTNDGQTGSGPLGATSITPNNEFAVVTDGCNGTMLAPGGSCIVKVVFSPSMAGTRSAMASVSATPGGTATATLTGTGLTPSNLQIMPNAFDFMTVDVGTSMTKTFTVQNMGGSPSGMLGAPTGISGAFSLQNDNCTGTTLAANGTCTFDVKFAPSTYGATSVSVTEAASPGGTAATNVSGTGRDFVTLTVTKSGTGTGSVSSSNGTLTCTGSTCTAQLARTGTPFATTTLTGTPDQSSTWGSFAGGGCSGTSTTCTVTMDQNQNVTATFNIKTVTITVVKSFSGSAGPPSVTSSDSAINCGSVCSKTYNWSQSTITLSQAGNGLTFYGWAGAPCGAKSTCTFDLTQDRFITANFGPLAAPPYMFITSKTYLPAQIGGLSGADTICNNLASAAGLPGTYAAWLSDSTTSAKNRVGSGGWIRPDGRAFAVSLTGITNLLQIFYPPRIDETGGDVGPGQTLVFGGHNGVGATFGNNNCNNWTTTNFSSVYVGQAGGASADWSYDVLESNGCSEAHHFYCFRTDTNMPVTNTVPPGRIAFVSKNAFMMSSTGLAAADAQCQGDAAAASLPGASTYIAFLATTTKSAAGRLNLGPGTPPFRRIDGTMMVDVAGDLAAGRIVAVPNQQADGSYVTWETWSGAPDPSSVGTNTCFDWTNTAAGNTIEGNEGGTQGWFNATPVACNYQFAHLLCMQP